MSGGDQLATGSASIARRGSVRNLQELYTVAIALAIAVAIERLMIGTRLSWYIVPMLVAFLATIIPFYHGAMRHLDETYVARDGKDMRAGGLLSDFVILFVQACLFFVFARTLPSAHAAAISLLVLLAVDVAWGLTVALLIRRNRRVPMAALKWVPINLIAVAMLTVLVAVDTGAPPSGHVDQPMAYALAGVSLARSIADFAVSWSFYFPPRDIGSRIAHVREGP